MKRNIKMKKLYIPNWIFILLSLALFACKKNTNNGGQPQNAPVAVKVDTVLESVVSYYDEYPANIVALNEVELRAQVNGYITDILVKDGDYVKKGQKLYVIDQQQYVASYEQALANLEVQKANFSRAEKDIERYRNLDKKDAISKQQLDAAEASFEVAKKQVEAAKAAVNASQTNVRYTSVVAPFDGIIGFSNVRLGSSVSAGQTLLNTISSYHPMAVDFTIDQKEIYRFTQLLNDQKNDSTFQLNLNREIYPSFGKITTIDRAVDRTTGAIKVRTVFDNKENLLRAGMSASIRVLNDGKTPSITIPYKSVTEMLGSYFVYVVGDSNVVEQRKIVLGKQIGKDIIIKNGLESNEIIVSEGVQKVRNGAVVTY